MWPWNSGVGWTHTAFVICSDRTPDEIANLKENVPEPITMTIIGVTVIVVAVFGYKTVKTVAEAPGRTINEGAEATRLLIESISGELRNLSGARPRVSVDKLVIQKATSAICEICLSKTEIQVTAEIQEQWMRSTKRLAASQTFTVKAGYDL